MKIGDHVVCVDISNYLLDDDTKRNVMLEKGKVYTISAVTDEYESFAVQVEELPWLVDEDGWYGHWRFKPLRKLDVEDFVTQSEPVA